MKKILKYILSLLMSFIKTKKNNIIIIESQYPSGSNTYKLNMELQKKNKYEVDVIYTNKNTTSKSSLLKYVNFIKRIIKVSQYKIVIIATGFSKYNKNQTMINLWHGIPMKSMAYMEGEGKDHSPGEFNEDYLITSSKLESNLMAACRHTEYKKHRILGSPRNDYLLSPLKDLGSLNFIKKYKSVIIYVPTFREGYLDRIEGKNFGNLFNFKYLDENRLINYLKSNNVLLVLKYHPFEEKQKKHKHSLCDNIFYLTNDILKTNNLDLYEFLPHTNLLITDYSSIYLDYLLLDKPIIFTPVDLEDYRENRGLLLEPYEYWTPGPRCIEQEILQDEILKSLNNPDYYKKEREEMRKIFHKFKDGKSTERVIELIEEILDK